MIVNGTSFVTDYEVLAFLGCTVDEYDYVREANPEVVSRVRRLMGDLSEDTTDLYSASMRFWAIADRRRAGDE